MEISNYESTKNKFGTKAKESFYKLQARAEVMTISKSYSVSYSHYDPGKVATCDESGNIYLISLENDSEIRSQMMPHTNSIFHVGWSNDDKYLLTASGDQSGGIWDIERLTGYKLCKHTGSVKCIKNSPISYSVYATASRDGKIYIWDTRISRTGGSRYTIYEPIAEIYGSKANAKS